MSTCPGCGRCRECGQPADRTNPMSYWYERYARMGAMPMPNLYPYPTTTPGYVVGDPMPGTPGYITVT